MLVKNLCLWVCLTLSAIANPESESQLSPRGSTPFTSTFDDLTPVDIFAAVVNAPEIGSYNGLRWQGFYTIQPGLFSGFVYLGGLLPNSGTNGAGYDTLGSVDTNTPFIVRKITVENRIINKPATVDLYSFWWGCQLGLKQYVLTTAVACNLTIIGEFAFQEKTRRTIRYQPILIQNVANMKFIDLGTQFRGLDTITFITQYDVGLNGATSFDDFTYVINR